MKRKATAVTAGVTILLCLAAAAVAGEAIAPATDSAPPTMVGLIVAIRDAKDAASAANSYARACTLDKDDVELYDTYMKKMLKPFSTNGALISRLLA